MGMGVNLWINRRKIYLDIYYSGSRWRESTGLSLCNDKSQQKAVWRLAEIIRSKRELQLVSQSHDLTDPYLGKQSLYAYIEELGRTKSKKEHCKKVLKYLKQYDNKIQLSAISSLWFESFQNWLLDHPNLSPQTCENYCNAIRAALKRATRDNIISKDPSTFVKHIRITEKIKSYLTIQEIRCLIKTPLGGELGKEIKKAFIFALYTGLRISDLKKIKWVDINEARMQVELQQGKTQRAVFIPLKQDIWLSLVELRKDTQSDFIFPKLSASKTNTNQYLVQWGKKAGILKPMGWHIARHSFATLSLEAGGDLFTVQKLLGHTKISTTQVYAKVTDQRRREIIDRFPDFGLEDENSDK
jgi:site-specific recombinase XerD